MVLSYAYNNYKTYDPADPASLDGQQFPFKGGRKSVNGGAISSYVGIPHITSAESGGTSLQNTGPHLRSQELKVEEQEKTM